MAGVEDMVGGYAGRYLWVDLESRRAMAESVDREVLQNFIGGYGVAARVLYTHMRPGVDALAGSNILAFATGPLTGSPAPTGTRWTVAAKSPLTATWGDANAGGHFGVALKRAGYDGVFFTGVSEEPALLVLDDGRVDLREANWLWGKDTYETEDLIRNEFGQDFQVACIGPAGESLSRISCIVHQKGRAAGRSGLGAVMGSKRLKAIAARGQLRLPLAQPEKVQTLRRKYLAQIKSGVGSAGFYRDTGTPGYTEIGATNGDSPTRNWAGVGPLEFANSESLAFDELVKKRVRRKGCWQCPLACWGTVSLARDSQTVEVHQPEYETMAAFGSNLLNSDLDSIIAANDICNRYGLDTISAGAVVAFAVECREKGLITRSDLGGIDLEWGEPEGILGLLELTARRTGFGAVLADGVSAAASTVGGHSASAAIGVGGQELPMHDPRLEPGLGLIYLIDATPGRHTQASQYVAPPGLFDDKPEYGTLRDEQERRGRDIKVLGALAHVMNASGLCLFGYLSTEATLLAEFLSAVTGWEYELDDLLLTGERIANIRRAFNARDHVNPLAYVLPERLYGGQPLDRGPTAGVVVQWKPMLAEFLREMDWTPEEALPRRRKLEELGLHDAAEDLWGGAE